MIKCKYAAFKYAALIREKNWYYTSNGKICELNIQTKQDKKTTYVRPAKQTLSAGAETANTSHAY